MNPLLAQLQNLDPKTSHDITLYLLGLIGVVVLLGNFFIAWSNSRYMRERDKIAQPRSIVPSPVEVKKSASYVTEDYCTAAHGTIVERVAKVETDVSELRGMVDEQVASLHEKVNRVDRSVAGLEADAKSQNQQLSEIRSDVKTLLRRAP